MKNPIQKKRELQLTQNLCGMQTVTTVTLFGIPLYRSCKKQNVRVKLY